MPETKNSFGAAFETERFEAERAKIVFINVPPSLKEDISKYFLTKSEQGDDNEEDIFDDTENEDFFLDDSIPIPIEIEDKKNKLKEEDFSWEMILSAMIKTLSFPQNYNLESRQISYYRRFVLVLKPDIYNELSGAAIIKARNGDFEMALEILELLEGVFPCDPGLLLNKALVLEDMAEHGKRKESGSKADAEDEAGKKVLEAYEKILSGKAVVPDAFLNAGFFFLKSKNYKRARECFSDYLSSTDGEPCSEEKRKEALSIIGDIEKRGLDDELFISAIELLREGDAEKALLKIKNFIENRPLVWNGWFVLGWALRMLCRWQESLDSYKKAVELGGANTDIKNEMAICYLETGDIQSAKRELEDALKEEPENIKIISNLGVAALKSGDNKLAAGFFRTVLELDPEDFIANTFFGNLE